MYVKKKLYFCKLFRRSALTHAYNTQGRKQKSSQVSRGTETGRQPLNEWEETGKKQPLSERKETGKKQPPSEWEDGRKEAANE